MAISIDELKVSYHEEHPERRDCVVVALPCGCDITIIPGISNSIGTPTQFRSYCDEHFPW